MAVALGDCFTLILTETGEMYGFGNNENGTLGVGDRIDHQIPVQVEWSKNQWNDDIPAIVFAGKEHSACVTTNGSLYMWGKGQDGRLGLDKSLITTGFVTVPTQVPLPTSNDSTQCSVAMVACGDTFSLLLTTDGKVLSCGTGEHGQLGLGPDSQQITLMAFIRHMPFCNIQITMIAAGVSHCIAMADTPSCSVWAWGSNQFGQLGLNDLDDRNIPCQIWVDTTIIINITAVFASGDSTALLANQNTARNVSELWTCGYGLMGVLGLGANSYSNKSCFTLVSADGMFGENGLHTVAMGLNHMIALTADKRVFTWGQGAQAQLGQRRMDTKRAPVIVSLNLPDGDYVKIVSAGTYHQSIVSNNGTLYTWGTWRNRVERRQNLPGRSAPHHEQTAREMPQREIGGERAGRWHLLSHKLFNVFSMGLHTPKSWENSPRTPVPHSPMRVLEDDALTEIHKVWSQQYTFEPNQHCGNGLRVLMGFDPK
jgi:alpha-tubulin suppressor-like RCC1 family protein